MNRVLKLAQYVQRTLMFVHINAEWVALKYGRYLVQNTFCETMI